jgi:hypothetical protein
MTCNTPENQGKKEQTSATKNNEAKTSAEPAQTIDRSKCSWWPQYQKAANLLTSIDEEKDDKKAIENMETAVDILENLADDGRGPQEALTTLATCYLSGWGVPQTSGPYNDWRGLRLLTLAVTHPDSKKTVRFASNTRKLYVDIHARLKKTYGNIDDILLQLSQQEAARGLCILPKNKTQGYGANEALKYLSVSQLVAGPNPAITQGQRQTQEEKNSDPTLSSFHHSVFATQESRNLSSSSLSTSSASSSSSIPSPSMGSSSGKNS